MPKNTVDVDAKNVEQILKAHRRTGRSRRRAECVGQFQYSRRVDGEGELTAVAPTPKTAPAAGANHPGNRSRFAWRPAGGWSKVIGSALPPHGSWHYKFVSAEPKRARLRQIYIDLAKVVRSIRPDGVSLEKVFFSRNVQSALKLGQARGVALLAAASKMSMFRVFGDGNQSRRWSAMATPPRSKYKRWSDALLSVRGPCAAMPRMLLPPRSAIFNRRAFPTQVAAAIGEKPTPLRPRGDRVGVERPMDHSLTLPVGST